MHLYIKFIQVDIQKCVILLKFFGKVKQTWEATYIDFGLRPKKLNMLVKTK
jgi:hypothetical protein